MISVGFKTAKAEIQVSTSDDTVSGSTGLTSGMSQENQTSSNEGRCGFWPQHRWAQGFSKCSPSQSLAPISPGLPSIPGKPVLWYLLLSPVITCVFTSLIDCGFYRAETKLYSSLKVSRGLTSCFMNEYWKGKCLLQHRSDQQLWCSGSCDLRLRSVEKECVGTAERRLCLGTTHLKAPYAAGTEQGTGEKTIPDYQAFIT